MKKRQKPTVALAKSIKEEVPTMNDINTMMADAAHKCYVSDRDHRIISHWAYIWCFVGAISSVMPLILEGVCPCIGSDNIDVVNKSVFGFQLSYIGFGGYLVLALTKFLQNWDRIFFWIHWGLTIGACLFVPFLMYRSITLHYLCLFCVVCWLMNIFLLFLTFEEMGSIRKYIGN